MYKVLVSENCPRCAIVKQRLQGRQDVEYIHVNSPEGKLLISQFRIRSAGTIVDTCSKEVIELNKMPI